MDAYDALVFPRTDVALNTLDFVRGIEDPAIFNHSLRTYLYGRFLGERQGLLPDRDYDDELLFLGCVLHDVGLTPEGNGDHCFHLDGADLASGFLTEQGVSPERAEVVWDAVALHLHREIALRKRPEIALVSAGAGFDLGFDGPYALPTEYTDGVHAALPRLHAAAVLHDAVVDQALDKPQKAPPFTLPGELVRQRTHQTWPAWEQLVTRPSGWNDYDGYRSKTRGRASVPPSPAVVPPGVAASNGANGSAV
ncbi:HD domain-containing protein [Streptomyces sp. Act-28]